VAARGSSKPENWKDLLFDDMDTNGDGKVEKIEFLEWIRTNKPPSRTVSDYQRLLGLHNATFVTRENFVKACDNLEPFEFQHVLRNLKPVPKKAAANSPLNKLDRMAALKTIATTGATFKLKLKSEHGYDHYTIAGSYMDAHRTGDYDKRNDDSTAVHVFQGEPKGTPPERSCQGEFKLEPGVTKDSYKIKLLSGHHNQPAGWYLDAHRICPSPKDMRNELSTYVHVFKPGNSNWHGDWAFEEGQLPNTYMIKLVSSHANQQPGWYLTAHSHCEFPDRRNGSENETRVQVSRIDDPIWRGEWELELT